MHCIKCAGSGQYMGNGMLSKQCEICNGCGKISSKESFKTYSKNSSAYKTAISEMLKSDANLTEKKAQELFDKAFHKE